MPTFSNGYTLNTIQELKSIPINDLTIGDTLLVSNCNSPFFNPCWYTFVAPLLYDTGINSLPLGDDDYIVIPDDLTDSSDTHRWLKHIPTPRSVKWTVVANSDYNGNIHTASPGEKIILIANNSQSITVELPTGASVSIPYGSEILFLNAKGASYNNDSLIEMKLANWGSYSEATGNTNGMKFTVTNTMVGVVYTGSTGGGWIPTVPNIFTPINI